MGGTEYGKYTSRLYKGITKAFFPRTYEALKPLQEEDYEEDERDGARKGFGVSSRFGSA